MAGKKISLAARVPTVADTIDARISVRPYGSTSSCDAVLHELKKESSLQFDPAANCTARKLIEQGM